MHIRRLEIKNIRAIEQLGLDLTSAGNGARRRLIILGANGSGKTTILKAISHVFADETADINTARRLNAGDVRTSRAHEETSAKRSGLVEFELCITPEEHREAARMYPLTVIPQRFPSHKDIGKSGHRLSPFDGPLLLRWLRQGQSDERRDQPALQPRQILALMPTPACVLLPADRGTLSDFEDVSVGSLSRFDPRAGCLFEDRARFRILPSLLALAFVAPKRNDPHGAIARMWKVMGTYIPDMPRPVDVHGLHMLFETPDGTIVSLQQLSDGQRAVLLLMGELALRNPAQGVVLIDEIEQHLHPRWQQAILDALLALLPEAQFILTTQAPYVAASAPDDVITIGNWEHDGPQ